MLGIADELFLSVTAKMVVGEPAVKVKTLLFEMAVTVQLPADIGDQTLDSSQGLIKTPSIDNILPGNGTNEPIVVQVKCL